MPWAAIASGAVEVGVDDVVFIGAGHEQCCVGTGVVGGGTLALIVQLLRCSRIVSPTTAHWVRDDMPCAIFVLSEKPFPMHAQYWSWCQDGSLVVLSAARG